MIGLMIGRISSLGITLFGVAIAVILFKEYKKHRIVQSLMLGTFFLSWGLIYALVLVGIYYPEWTRAVFVIFSPIEGFAFFIGALFCVYSLLAKWKIYSIPLLAIGGIFTWARIFLPYEIIETASGIYEYGLIFGSDLEFYAFSALISIILVLPPLGTVIIFGSEALTSKKLSVKLKAGLISAGLFAFAIAMILDANAILPSLLWIWYLIEFVGFVLVFFGFSIPKITKLKIKS
jgi:hypothetical protein